MSQEISSRLFSVKSNTDWFICSGVSQKSLNAYHRDFRFHISSYCAQRFVNDFFLQSSTRARELCEMFSFWDWSIASTKHIKNQNFCTCHMRSRNKKLAKAIQLFHYFIITLLLLKCQMFRKTKINELSI